MKKYRILMAALLALPMLWACTDVDLCNEGEHPHRATITYEYANANVLPDTMIVLANRVLNLWKSTMKVKSTTGTGHYMTNAPSVWNDSTGTYETVTGSVGNFRMPVGDYKFITFNLTDDEIDYSELRQYVADPEMPLAGINLTYRTYAQQDSRLGKILVDWTDYNRYADYIQPSTKPLYYDTINVFGLSSEQHMHLTFKPIELTQEIQFSFTIQKKVSKQAFRIDSVFADLSGIPRAMNLSSGHLDITRTNKLMFRMNKLNDKDASTSVTCSATIHVPGVVPPRHNKITTGPGILQLYICCSAPGATQREVKRIPVLINLYNTLKKTPSIALADDQKSAHRTAQKLAVKIVAKDLMIDGEKVVADPDTDSGLDQWQPLDSDFIVVDV